MGELLKRITGISLFQDQVARACLKAEGLENRVVKNAQEGKQNGERTEGRELALGLERRYDPSGKRREGAGAWGGQHKRKLEVFSGLIHSDL